MVNIIWTIQKRDSNFRKTQMMRFLETTSRTITTFRFNGAILLWIIITYVYLYIIGYCVIGVAAAVCTICYITRPSCIRSFSYLNAFQKRNARPALPHILCAFNIRSAKVFNLSRCGHLHNIFIPRPPPPPPPATVVIFFTTTRSHTYITV